MSAKERKELKALADAKGLTVSSYVRMLVKEDIERKKSSLK